VLRMAFLSCYAWPFCRATHGLSVVLRMAFLSCYAWPFCLATHGLSVVLRMAFLSCYAWPFWPCGAHVQTHRTENQSQRLNDTDSSRNNGVNNRTWWSLLASVYLSRKRRGLSRASQRPLQLARYLASRTCTKRIRIFKLRCKACKPSRNALWNARRRESCTFRAVLTPPKRWNCEKNVNGQQVNAIPWILLVHVRYLKS
jgi:hypothetical protein